MVLVVSSLVVLGAEVWAVVVGDIVVFTFSNVDVVVSGRALVFKTAG